jgi:predicted nucleic acid-binding protein
VIYLDSSAIVKLIRPEDESGELNPWLLARSDMPFVSSALIEVEVPRSLLRLPSYDEERLEGVMARIGRLAADRPVRFAAAHVHPPGLRSLDAIHLATALLLGPELQAFVTYDKRLLDAARAAALPVASPGA